MTRPGDRIVSSGRLRPRRGRTCRLRPAAASPGDSARSSLAADRLAPDRSFMCCRRCCVVLAFVDLPADRLALSVAVPLQALAKGGFSFDFIGLCNYRQAAVRLAAVPFPRHLEPLWRRWPGSFVRWSAAGAVAGSSRCCAARLHRARPRSAAWSSPWRWSRLALLFAAASSWRAASSGTLAVTLIYVFVGVAAQYLLGLGLALLCAQPIAGRRFFRVVFFLPMMITPVGVAYTFRMLTDTHKGPFAPLWQLFGLADFSWAADRLGRAHRGDDRRYLAVDAVHVHRAAGGAREPAARAGRGGAWWTAPAAGRSSATSPGRRSCRSAAPSILIRLIEAFKIVDLPNVLTNGGPGIATELLTLHAFIAWRTLDLGGSAAVGLHAAVRGRLLLRRRSST